MSVAAPDLSVKTFEMTKDGQHKEISQLNGTREDIDFSNGFEQPIFPEKNAVVSKTSNAYNIKSQKRCCGKLTDKIKAFIGKQLILYQEYTKTVNETEKNSYQRINKIFLSAQPPLTLETAIRKHSSKIIRNLIFKNVIVELIKNIIPIIFGGITIVSTLKQGIKNPLSMIMFFITLISSLMPIISIIKVIRKLKAFKEGYNKAIKTICLEQGINTNSDTDTDADTDADIIDVSDDAIIEAVDNSSEGEDSDGEKS